VVNFRHPITSHRQQLFFKSHKEAVAGRDALVAGVVTGTYSPEGTKLTVAEAVEHWLESRHPEVKRITWTNYRNGSPYITEPLLIGAADDRRKFTEKGLKPEGAGFIEMLGHVRVAELTTAQIRSWHRTVSE